MNLTPLKSDFTAGELSPLMHNRTEVEGHDKAVEIMENVIALPQGPAFSRFPFKLFKTIPAEFQEARVEIIDFSDSVYVIIVFVHLGIFFYLDDGTELPSAITQYSADELDDLYFIESPAGNTFYVAHQNHPPAFIEYDDAAGTVEFLPLPIVPIPPEWGVDNYPACGVVNRGRLWFANTPLQPEQFWASRVGDHLDFLTGPQEEDAFSVVNEHYGSIEWMLSTKDLIFGTENGEYIITSQGPVVFIGDIRIDRQSTFGSASIKAHQIGDRIIYPSRDSEKLYGMQYDRDVLNWMSEEFSFPSQHVLLAKVRDTGWEQHPISLYWLVLRDGTMACMSYNPSMQIIGWHRHHTQGNFLSIATGTKSGETHVVSIVDRGTGVLHIETSGGGGHPMDSRIDRDMGVPTNIIDGLEALNGFDCQVVADGAVHPNRTVVGGQIELQLDATLVEVGLGYRKRIKTLPFDKGSPTGSARAFTKRYKDVYLSLLNSAIPMVNGKLVPIRHPVTPMNTAEPFTTGLIKISNLGFDLDAPVDIIQDGPLPLNITGIYGEVVQDKT